MRYHSPFMMKSDKSPPSFELSTRSSYQGQSLIKTGTYLHDGDIPLGNLKPNMRMQLWIPFYVYVYYTFTRWCIRKPTLRDKACNERIRSAVGWCEEETVISLSGSSAPCAAGKTRSCGRQAENWLFIVAENCFSRGQEVLVSDGVFATCSAPLRRRSNHMAALRET